MPKMDSSSGSDLEVEVRSDPIPRKEDEGPIASGLENRPAAVKDVAAEIEFVDLKGNEIKMPTRVLEVLEGAADFKEFRAKRKFRYLHLFSGDPDVLGEAVVEERARNQIWVESVGLDRKANNEIDLHEIDTILKWKKEIEEDQWDGLHSGWPCGSFSMARWKPGGPPPVRSREEIYGLSSDNARQQQEADRGTLAATRSVALMKLQCQRADARGIPRVATGENPPGTDGKEGSAWILPEVVVDLQEMEAEEAVFNTCAFQEGKTRWFKPGKWAGKLGEEGMADMRRICKCPNWVKHQPLIGKELTEPAGQYPKKLVELVARKIIMAFKKTLNLEWWRYQMATKKANVTELQKSWLKNEDKKRKIAELSPMLLKEDGSRPQIPTSSSKVPKKEVKEKQDDFFLGGMRNPARAVSKMHRLGKTGMVIRRAWEKFWDWREEDAIKLAEEYGTQEAKFDEDVLADWREELLKTLKATEDEGVRLKDNFMFKSPLQSSVWKAWIDASGDPDTALKDWIEEGVPLGMNKAIPGSNGVFPPAMGEQEGELDQTPELAEQLGLENYSSVREFETEAREELARYEEKNFARIVDAEELTKRFPDKGTMSKLAIILKVKEDGTRKSRIILDMRKSGGNARCRVPERITLPRATDVVEGAKWMRENADKLEEQLRAEDHRDTNYRDTDPDQAELFSVDLADAFCHWPVCQEELANCVAPHVDPGKFVVFVALLFGFKGAPLLMGRLSSAIGRLLQALVHPWELQTQVYIDDILGVLAGPIEHRQKLLAMALYTLGAFGINISLRKGERGRRLKWIGVTYDLDYPNKMVLGIPQKMVDELKLLLETAKGRGMIGVRTLRSLVGKLSWMAGVIPRMRWVVNVGYATLHSAAEDSVEKEIERAKARTDDKRIKVKLIHLKRLGPALPWLEEALQQPASWLIRHHKLEDLPVLWGVVTDASPMGLGGVLLHRDGPERDFTAMQAFEAKFTKEEADMFGVTHGESSSQAFVECLAVFRAITAWGSKIRGQKLLIKSDSTVALGMSQKLASPNQGLNWLAAELALQLERSEVAALIPYHIAGIYNVEADYLSRWHDRPDQLPPGLVKVKIRSLKPLTRERFALDPPGSEGFTASSAAWSGVR